MPYGWTVVGQDSQPREEIVEVFEVQSFQDALETSQTDQSHLLLGNGFSIAAHQGFEYRSLWNQIYEDSLPWLQEVMDASDTHDLEDLLQAIHGGASVDYMEKDHEDYNTILDDHITEFEDEFMQSISSTHPNHPDFRDVADWACCSVFLNEFYHVFTLNYDLLLYWAHNNQILQKHMDLRKRRDGFWNNDVGQLAFDPRCFDGEPGLYYVHGGFHLFQEEQSDFKRRWEQGNYLTKQLRDGLNEGVFPLFVSGGDYQQKAEKINSSPYLRECYRRFMQVEGTLFTYGASFAENDRHICTAIAGNRSLSGLCIGVYDESDLPHYEGLVEGLHQEREERGFPELEITFYDSTSVHLW